MSGSLSCSNVRGIFLPSVATLRIVFRTEHNYDSELLSALRASKGSAERPDKASIWAILGSLIDAFRNVYKPTPRNFLSISIESYHLAG